MSNLIKRFARNTAGRDLVIGDIHGCFTKALAALEAVGFDPADGERDPACVHVPVSLIKDTK